MSIDRGVDKEDVVYTYNGILLSCKKKKNEIMSLAATWMDLEIIILSEVSHKKTNIIYNLYVESKNSANGLIYKTERDPQT